MKAESAGKRTYYLHSAGFSTLEIMIAMAIMAIVLAGALSANFAAQYWSLSSQTSNEGLYKAKTQIEDLRSLAGKDFYEVASTPFVRSMDAGDPNDAACIAGGLCYYTEAVITDLSLCSKYVRANVAWKIGSYATSTTALFTHLTHIDEIIALGGDCLLSQPEGNWASGAPQSVGSLAYNPGKLFTGVDVFHKEIYATASTSPYFLVYNVPTSVGQNPVLAGSTDGGDMRLNAVDAIEDLATGRTYAFAAEHKNNSQLAVFDVTDPALPVLVVERQLGSVDPLGSYPQGWKVFAYGNRLYLTTRETAGNEFHIFNINVPTQPVEVGSGFEVNRTVNDFIVREQKVGGVLHRYVFLAADSNLKELSVLDVTSDVTSEVAAIDLPGDQDGLSLALVGHQLYLGRVSNVSGPELYVFDVTDPTLLTTAAPQIIGQGEVGADVSSLRVSGAYAYLGTSKAGQEFQVWDTLFTGWDPLVLNDGRLSSFAFPNLAPTGIDFESAWVYGVSQRAAAPGDALQVLYRP